MLKEKKTIIKFRILFACISIAFIIACVILGVTSVFKPTAQHFETTYFETHNQTACHLELEFPKIMWEGKVKIQVFDEQNKSLGVYKHQLDDFKSKKVSVNFFVNNGKATSYKIIHCYAIDKTFFVGTLICCVGFLISLLYFIFTLCLKYRIYNVKNNEILIFAGFNKNYIKVNGEIKDELAWSSGFGYIYLSCKIDEDFIEATITSTRKIYLQCNNEFVPYDKKQTEKTEFQKTFFKD